jgi:hypothetical protein
VAEWSNAPDSKSGVLVFQYRGFESLLARHDVNEINHLRVFLGFTHHKIHHPRFDWSPPAGRP